MAATVAVPPRAAQRRKAGLGLILCSLQDGTVGRGACGQHNEAPFRRSMAWREHQLKCRGLTGLTGTKAAKSPIMGNGNGRNPGSAARPGRGRSGAVQRGVVDEET